MITEILQLYHSIEVPVEAHTTPEKAEIKQNSNYIENDDNSTLSDITITAEINIHPMKCSFPVSNIVDQLRSFEIGFEQISCLVSTDPDKSKQVEFKLQSLYALTTGHVSYLCTI